MEKQIKIIWILSLLSALLLIGVQGYWLYNQFAYAMQHYSEEQAAAILRAGDAEYAIRKKEVPDNILYVINRNTKYSRTAGGQDTQQQQISMQLNVKDSISTQLNQMHLHFNPQMSEDSLYASIDKAIINTHTPFQLQRMDSILRASLRSTPYAISPLAGKDTTCTASYWQKSGNTFHCGIKVVYIYSPVEHKGVCISASIPVPSIVSRMAIQLALSLCLILLLLGCLILQIKTILKQQRLGELRQNFVNTMIHELKRPVQTLKMFVSFLGDKDMRTDEAATEQVVQDSMFELDNLSAYLNKLKDMVQADNEATPIQPSRFDIKQLVGKVIRLINLPAGKQVELTSSFDLDSTWVLADPVHLANIISNLIENAVKYSEDRVNIDIQVVQKGKHFSLTVSDTGMGILPAEQAKVFNKFYRSPHLRDKNIPGLGLGLSYVKLITEAHHGTVSLQSILGRGTSVIINIPQ